MPVRECLSNYSNKNLSQLIWYDCGWIGQRRSAEKTTSPDIAVTQTPTHWSSVSFDFWRREWQLEQRHK